MTSYLFEKEIRIFGLKRSGKSSCADYIWNHFSKDSRVYLHNTGLTFSSRHRESLDKTIGKIEKVRYKGCCINSIEHMSLVDVACKLKDKNSKYNQEKQIILDHFNKEEFAKKVYDVLILRSYHNNLADLFRLQSMHYVISSFWAKWIEYAKEYVGEFNYLKDKCLFNYDFWNLSRDYRMSFSENLELDYNYFHQWNKKQKYYEKGKREIYTNKDKLKGGNAFRGWEKCIKRDYPHKEYFVKLISDCWINYGMKVIFDIDMKKTMRLN